MTTFFKARYHEHHTAMANEFFKWFKNGTHVDVTIHAGGHRVKAHKLVLAAHSPFFNGVFLDTENENSHLYFTDVPIQSMKSLIEYMYSGDLVVEREFLPACLKLADSLRVKGISGISVDDIITEPAPVSAKMHNLINTLMQQYPQHQEQLQQQQQQQQQHIPHQTPKQQFTRNQKKKLNRKSRKMLGRNGGSTEKGVPHVTSKLVFKRIKNTNGYKLEQFRSPKDDNKNALVERNISISESQQQAPNNLNNNSNFEDQLNLTQNVLPVMGTESENENKNYPSEEMLTDDKNEEFANTQDVSVIPPYIDQELADIYNENQCDSTTHFQSEVLERNVTNLGANDNISLSTKEQNDLSSNENSHAINTNSSAKFTSIPSLNSTSQEIQHDKKAVLKKDAVKAKKCKITSRLSTQNHLDQELERLFGDNFFGIDKKNNIESIKNLCDFPNQNEQCIEKPLINMPMIVDNVKNQQAEPKKKNGNRRRMPICPPPEDISQNGKPSFGCSLCKRVYTHKSNYRRHYMVFHKRCAEAVFQCPMCKKKFTRSDNRTHHIRRIHGYTNTASLLSEEQALFLCPICKKAFTRSYNRTFHLAEEHGIRSPAIIEK